MTIYLYSKSGSLSSRWTSQPTFISKLGNVYDVCKIRPPNKKYTYYFYSVLIITDDDAANRGSSANFYQVCIWRTSLPWYTTIATIIPVDELLYDVSYVYV